MSPSASLGTVLIVGGTGLLGHHLAQEITKTHPDTTVHASDLNINKPHLSGVQYHHCDITSLPDLSRILQATKPDVVFHTASPDPFCPSRSILEKVNIAGTQNLLDVAKAVGTVIVFVYISSASVVHDHYQGV